MRVDSHFLFLCAFTALNLMGPNPNEGPEIIRIDEIIFLLKLMFGKQGELLSM